MSYDLDDAYRRRARQEGYAARAAYKLAEIQKRYRLIRKGDRVLDLGCAPGSWLQKAHEIAGPQSTIVGIDLVEVRPDVCPAAKTLEADFFSKEGVAFLEEHAPYDVVLSDMAPKTSGIKSADQARSLELCEGAWIVARRHLKPGGHFVCKIFQGAGFPEFLQELRRAFEKTHGFKPKSSRSASMETYVVGLGWRGEG
ncbi:MAG: RlmE family RNA methyltransferase [Planctomycetota bacterium]